MLYAAYYHVDWPNAHEHPIGLYDSIDKARKACVRTAMKMQSVTITKSHFKWEEWADNNSNFTRAEALIPVNKDKLKFNIRVVGG